jgi:class 3 adenylate cyclase
VLVCTSCGAENREGARFCDSCGSPLGEAAPMREVRKVVTVLFCDVTGSTALGERIDPESLRRVMSRYFETAKAIVVRHGGTVEKFIGDAVMAVFGVPTVHEDDALRAVRAAEELRGALGSLNDELERDYGTRLELRMGVNTGEVVTGTEERLATGYAVNVAARLEQAAQPGEVLLGEETHRLVRGAVEAEPAPPLAAKGKSEPLSAYRLLSVQADAPGRRHDAPMIGRERQQRMLAGAFANVVSERACHLFTILGAAGVGKSRLAAARVDADGADRLLAHADELVEPTDFIALHFDAALARAEVSRHTGRAAEARAALEHALELAGRKENVLAAAQARARLDALAG